MPNFDRQCGPLFGGTNFAGKDKRHARKFARGNARAFARIRRAQDMLAGDLMPQAEGDQLHMILENRRLNPGDMLTALCQSLPGGVKHLRISTLTLSAERNLLQLTDLVDSGAVSHLTLLLSEMFRDKASALWSKVTNAFNARQQCTIAASRTHAKICCLDCPDGRAFVFYGSGNLRTAKSDEQLTLCLDRGVHDFYADWIDEQVNHGAGQS